MSSARLAPILGNALGLMTVLLLVSSCLERRDPSPADSAVARCTACHGERSRSGDALRRAAPPADLLGRTDVHNPGVGAHSIHLDGSGTHARIACAECHVVPARVDSPGHADTAGPAEIAFGALATHGDRTPRYDPVGRTCGNTYCHGGADAVWTEPKTSDQACGSCHDLPPRAPHPESKECWSCHGAVVDTERHIIAPGLHVNGAVDFAPGKCVDCHGSADSPAPPRDVSGNVSASAIGVGAHQVHLAGGSSGRPLACGECHLVPQKLEDPTHADGLPAEVLFTGVAATQARAPRWVRDSATCENTWCHGPDPGGASAPPRWVHDGSLGCTSCHGGPPAAPHPQMTECSRCHAAVVADDNVTITDRTRHIDGVVDVSVPTSCTACHGGSKDAAPLPGTPGAGAHRTHLDGTPESARVPCGACHIVPSDPLASGHIDTPRPGELTFAGRAIAGGASPAYGSGTCTGTPCHGGALPDGNESGGSNTVPDWNRVDGSQATCGACHAIPPPPPHPYVDLNPVCSACHKDIAADNRTFIRPDLHVDGEVTFELPP